RHLRAAAGLRDAEGHAEKEQPPVEARRQRLGPGDGQQGDEPDEEGRLHRAGEQQAHHPVEVGERPAARDPGVVEQGADDRRVERLAHEPHDAAVVDDDEDGEGQRLGGGSPRHQPLTLPVLRMSRHTETLNTTWATAAGTIVPDRSTTAVVRTPNGALARTCSQPKVTCASAKTITVPMTRAAAIQPPGSSAARSSTPR